MLRMVGRDGEAYLYSNLEAPVGGEEYNVRRTEGVVGGQKDTAMVDSSRKIRVDRPSDCEVPFEQVIL